MSAAREQALALAGVAQFALYAHELAAEGVQPSVRIKRALGAIFCTDPKVTEDVFDGIAGVTDGRRFLRMQLEGGDARNETRNDTRNTGVNTAMVSRYIGQILRLSSRLRRDSESLRKISTAIEQARLLDETQAPRVLDETYQNTISKLRPRIMMRGQQAHLSDAQNAERIRTFLLAAIRCAILWRQAGGSFWRLLLQRGQLADALNAIAQESPAPRDFD